MSNYRDDDRRGGSGSAYEPRTPLPTRSMMGSRIYVGKLPSNIRDSDIEKVFGKYGKIGEVAMKGNYCFIQYESSRGAKDAVYELNNRTVWGERVQVEHARTPKEFGFRAPSRSQGGYSSSGYYRSSGSYTSRYGYSSGRSSGGYSGHRRSPPRRSDFRLSVTNLSTRCSWQDLKAVMQKAGEVVFSDAHRRRVGEGVVEFATEKDMEKALKRLDGLEINGKPIKLEIEEVRKPRKHSRSRSRSSSRSHSRSKSKSRSRSRTPRRKLRRRSSSRSRSRSRSASEENDRSHNEDENRGADKSDDEEFEAAERSVEEKKKQRQVNGDNDSDGGASDDERKPSTNTEGGGTGEDEEVVEEIVEEVEEEVEVDEEENQADRQ